MEKKLPYEVTCKTHGLLAFVAQAVLGLPIFEEHRKLNEGCMGCEIKPISERKPFNKENLVKVIWPKND